MAGTGSGPEGWAEDGTEDGPDDGPDGGPDGGPDDGFYERFADELEVLAELGGGTGGGGGGTRRERAGACVPSGDRHRALTPPADEPSPPARPKTSQFRGKKQPPEEPEPPGDSPGDTNAKKRDRDCVPAVSPAAAGPCSRFGPVSRVLLPAVPPGRAVPGAGASLGLSVMLSPRSSPEAEAAAPGSR